MGGNIIILKIESKYGNKSTTYIDKIDTLDFDTGFFIDTTLKTVWELTANTTSKMSPEFIDSFDTVLIGDTPNEPTAIEISGNTTYGTHATRIEYIQLGIRQTLLIDQNLSIYLLTDNGFLLSEF